MQALSAGRILYQLRMGLRLDTGLSTHLPSSALHACPFEQVLSQPDFTHFPSRQTVHRGTVTSRQLPTHDPSRQTAFFTLDILTQVVAAFASDTLLVFCAKIRQVQAVVTYASSGRYDGIHWARCIRPYRRGARTGLSYRWWRFHPQQARTPPCSSHQVRSSRSRRFVRAGKR